MALSVDAGTDEGPGENVRRRASGESEVPWPVVVEDELGPGWRADFPSTAGHDGKMPDSAVGRLRAPGPVADLVASDLRAAASLLERAAREMRSRPRNLAERLVIEVFADAAAHLCLTAEALDHVVKRMTDPRSPHDLPVAPG